MRLFRARARLFRAFALLVGFLAVAGALDAQEPVIVRGTVIDIGDSVGVAGVRVALTGTRFAVFTGRDGAFIMRGVPPGRYTLEAGRLGYAPARREIEVQPGGSELRPIALVRVALDVEGVVVSAAGGRQPRHEIGSAVAVFRPAPADLAAATTLQELLSARVPGLMVRSTGGTTGAGDRIRIRWANSPFLSNEPLVIVDGVRIAGQGPQFASTALNGQLPSRLNDIAPEDVESVEVLRGPAASALYGTAAANGVIQIRTRTGVPGATRWTLFSEVGEIRDRGRWPANVRGYGTDSAGLWGLCPLVGNGPSQAGGTCTLESIESLNVMRDPRTTPFRTGGRTRIGGSAGGGGTGSSFFVSGDLEEERGVYGANRSNRARFRSNLAADLGPHATGRVALAFASTRTSLPHNDNSGFGLILNGLLGASSFEDGFPRAHAYWNGLSPEVVDRYRIESDTERWILGTSAEWRALDWLTATGSAGMDQYIQHDHRRLEAGTHLRIFGSPFDEGFRESSRLQARHLNLDASLTARSLPLTDLTAATTAGVGITRVDQQRTAGFGAGLLGGTGSLEGTTSLFSVAELNRQEIAVGALLRQQIAWRERLFIAGSVRADRDGALGADVGATLYPAVSVSWLTTREPFMPRIPGLETLRLRAAWGESGLRPGFRRARTYFDAHTVRLAEGEVPAISPGGTGNRELRPELVREGEVGFDAGLFSNRIGLEVTAYRKVSRDALVSRPIPPSMGLTETRFENLGSVSNLGGEALLRADLLQVGGAELSLTAGGAVNRNRIDRLGEGVSDIIFGLNGDTQRHSEGHSLGAYFQAPIRGWSDESGSGIVEPGELDIPLDDGGRPVPAFLGHSLPTRQVTFAPELRVRGRFSLTARFDHHGGHHLLNGTRLERCASGTFRHRCVENFDAEAPVPDQIAVVAVEQAGTLAGFIEPADFWKLREVALEFVVPSTWLAPLGTGIEGASLFLSARNLYTWTDYSGVDPEVNNTGTVNHNSADFGTQPAPRYLMARFVVTLR